MRGHFNLHASLTASQVLNRSSEVITLCEFCILCFGWRGSFFGRSQLLTFKIEDGFSKNSIFVNGNHSTRRRLKLGDVWQCIVLTFLSIITYSSCVSTLRATARVRSPFYSKQQNYPTWIRLLRFLTVRGTTSGEWFRYDQ